MSALRARGAVEAPRACLGLHSLAGLEWAKRAGVPLLGGNEKEVEGEDAYSTA